MEKRTSSPYDVLERAITPGADFKKPHFRKLREVFDETYKKELDRENLRLAIERDGLTLPNRLRLTKQYLEDNPAVVRTMGLLVLAAVAGFAIFEIRETAVAVTETMNRFSDLLSSAVSVDVKQTRSLGGVGPSLPDIPATLSEHAQRVEHAKEAFTNQVGATFGHTRNAAFGLLGTRIGLKIGLKI